jgi:4-hydroxy-3-polyprenylbenzoate decarboxylase
MALKDNREYIDALEKMGDGDIIRIKEEIDWDLEAGAIVRRTCEQRGPAVLFERIKDYPDGYRLFGAPIATYRRLSIAMGLPPETHPKEIIAEYSRRTQTPIKPAVVKEAPCQEVVISGQEVDLFSLPCPMVHDGDGGRYIGTWHLVIGQDPDTGWTNWGMYRLMVYNERLMSGLILPVSDMGKIFYGKYVPKKQPMPVAIAIGADPLSSLMSMTRLPADVSEVDFAGAIRQEPVELVKCLTNDLMVPAHSEIILEGELLPDVTIKEGPFGEFTGYRSSPQSPRSLYRVNAITHRRNPILTISNMGVPVDDCSLGMSVSFSCEAEALLKKTRIPYTAVYVPPEGTILMAIVAVKRLYNNVATQIASLLFSAWGGAPTTVIVVDEDVDPFNLHEVFHALATKCHPVNGITVCPHEVGMPLAPFLNLEERKWGKGSRVVFDCTWPLDWPKETAIPDRSSFANMYPQEVRDRVMQNWKKWGF